MITKRLLISLVALMLSSVGYAQRVINQNIDGVPYVVIDCSHMKSYAYTTEKKGSSENELKTKQANTRVYKTFAIATNDGGAINGELWSNAIKTCANKGPNWRLPVLRELILMNVLYREIVAMGNPTGSFVPMKNLYYWSATEYQYGQSNAGSALFPNGLTQNAPKTDRKRVRCIREL